MDFLRWGRDGVLEVKLIWNLAELGGVVLEKIPSMGEVRKFLWNCTFSVL